MPGSATALAHPPTSARIRANPRGRSLRADPPGRVGARESSPRPRGPGGMREHHTKALLVDTDFLIASAREHVGAEALSQTVERLAQRGARVLLVEFWPEQSE